MPQVQLIFEAIVLSRVLYAVQSFGVVTLLASTQKIKVKRWRLVNVDYSLIDMLADCDKTLFKAAGCDKHRLNHMFTVNNENVHRMSLRQRGHSFILPLLKFQSTRNSFVNRSLFSYV